jgi:hypothetical protein
MSGRAQPLNGADSADAYVLSPFRVTLDCWDGGRTVVVVNALGKHDAYNLARERAIDLGYDPMAVLRIEPVSA